MWLPFVTKRAARFGDKALDELRLMDFFSQCFLGQALACSVAVQRSHANLEESKNIRVLLLHSFFFSKDKV